MVNDKVAAQERRDDKGRYACPRAPLIVYARRTALAWWCHVVPLPAELIVGDHDHSVFCAAAAFNRTQERHQMIAAARLACVARVLVLRCERLDEADGVELAFGV